MENRWICLLIEPLNFFALSQHICWQPQVITISVKIISIRSSTVAVGEFFHWLRRLQKPLNDPIIKQTFFKWFHMYVTFIGIDILMPIISTSNLWTVSNCYNGWWILLYSKTTTTFCSEIQHKLLREILWPLMAIIYLFFCFLYWSSSWSSGPILIKDTR